MRLTMRPIQEEGMGRKITLALALIFQASLSHAAGDVAAGKRAFAKCASCHQVGPSARGGFGPQLNGILGRPAASTQDYKYSDAMKNSGIVWTEARLRAFLKAPGNVVPNTKMRFFGIGSDQEISDLLAYLRIFRQVQED